MIYPQLVGVHWLCRVKVCFLTFTDLEGRHERPKKNAQPIEKSIDAIVYASYIDPH